MLKQLLKTSLCASVLLVSQAANAHTQWLKPNLFNTALNGKTVWLSGQMAIAEYPFVTERNLEASASIQLPTGELVTIDAIHAGKTSSLFDYELTAAGTYKLVAQVGPSVRKPRPMPAGSTAAPRPTTRTISLLTTYITADAPNKTVLQADKNWLDIVPVTHPADIVDGESATFKVFYQGKPLPNHPVTLAPNGGEYVNHVIEQEFVTNAAGEVSINLSKAGVYLLKASHTVALENDPEAQELRCSAGLTFEAQLN